MNDDIETLYHDAIFAIGDDDFDDAVDTLNQMLLIAPDSPYTIEIQGDLAKSDGQLLEADRYYRRLLETATDDYWKGVAYTSLGVLWGSAEQGDRVRGYFVSAVGAFLACGAEDSAVAAYAAIARFDIDQGEFERAIESLQAAITLFEKSTAPDEIESDVGTVRLMLGTCYRQLGKLDQAKPILNEALKLFQKLEEPDQSASTLDALGILEQIQGDDVAAEKLHLKAVEMNAAIHFQAGLSSNYGNLAILHIHRSQWDQAADWAGKAYLIDKDNNDENGIAHYHLLMGEIEFERGNTDRAEDHLQQAAELYKECGDAEDIIGVQGKTAVLYRQQGKLDEASEINERILVEAERMGHREGIAAILEDLGQVRKAQGRTEDARQFWQRSLTLYEELGAQKMIAEVQRELAGL